MNTEKIAIVDNLYGRLGPSPAEVARPPQPYAYFRREIVAQVSSFQNHRTDYIAESLSGIGSVKQENLRRVHKKLRNADTSPADGENRTIVQLLDAFALHRPKARV